MTRIEEIKAEIAKLQKELADIQGGNKLIEVVASSRSMKEAGEKLDLKPAEVQKSLEALEIPHFYGESWPFACRRYLNAETAVDTYTYPKSWEAKVENLVGSIKRDGFKDTHEKALNALKARGEVPETTKTITNVLGRFLQINGYNTKGEEIGVPEWMN